MMFWRNKRVLITGHTGFKGSWLSLLLQYLQAEVGGYSLLPPTDPNLFTLTNVENGMRSVIGDVRDLSLLQKYIKEFQPEVIFHMAAQSLVRYSYQNPVETYATNVLGTVHLLESVRHVGSVRVIINVTSDKCYENKETQQGYKEDDVLGGFDPYSNSKACAELVTSAFRNSYFRDSALGLASVRAGNVIGGGDWAQDRLVPDILRAYINKQAVVIRNPKALRPWQHVLEPINGYLLLAERLYHSPTHYAEGWNFGPDEDDIQSVGWIVDYIASQLGVKQQWIKDDGPHPHETKYLKLNCDKAKEQLGWKPRWNLQIGLDETIKWYQAYINNENLTDFTLNQIHKFIRSNSYATSCS